MRRYHPDKHGGKNIQEVINEICMVTNKVYDTLSKLIK